MYVLAAKPRAVVAQDVDTNEACYVPLKVALKESPETAVSYLAPCILPEISTIASICVDGPRYWPIRLDLEHNAAHLQSLRDGVIFVKRKAGYIPYAQDRKAISALEAGAGLPVGSSVTTQLPDEDTYDKAGGLRFARSVAANSVVRPLPTTSAECSQTMLSSRLRAQRALLTISRHSPSLCCKNALQTRSLR